MKVNCYQCPDCSDIVFSRARHDCRYCSCGLIGIDGGFDYTRLIGKGKRLIRNIRQTKHQLEEDWSTGNDKYGIIKL